MATLATARPFPLIQDLRSLKVEAFGLEVEEIAGFPLIQDLRADL